LNILVVFCIGLKLGFFSGGGGTFQKEVHRTMLELKGDSNGRATGLKGCIPYINIEKIKLNI
jgi:hypothetical protein